MDHALLGGLCLLIVGYAFLGFESTAAPRGRLVPAAYRKEVQWRIVDANMVESGATLPTRT